MAKMLQKIAFTFMTLIYKVDPHFIPNDGLFAADIKVPLDPATPRPAMNLPEYQRITASEVQMDLFRPDQDLKRVPDLLYPVFHPSEAQPPKSSTSTYKPVGMLCHLDRIYVRVLKSLFTNPDAYKYLKVGSCAVNQATDTHYYVLYALNGCDGQRQENQDSVIYSNTLRYEPEETTELVVRELPFSVGLECHYHKHHRSYQLGYYPEVFKETIFVGLTSGASITHVDERGDVLLPVRSYSIGEPMYFEVKAHSRDTAGRRVYLNKCYISASEDLTATPTYTVLDNYGCLVDSKQNAQSKFYPSTDESTVRFSVASVLFKDLISQPKDKRIMFVHCEMTLGPQTPAPSAKSCTYDLSTKRWTELLGDDSVCTCCDTSCPAPESSDTATMMISSNPWEIV
ncbi:zona pellucida sperm-binding protein 3-like [Astyanax mexicanus]|uniref:Zona pellucida sperm-binding protein 3-like n=1 Tax=Astyanax mexicanus TaxID=7994 RepID=A0A8T2KSW2_ASTMX|nr:zona pellucida sperm-binding protein 3-like [Astyanax mexicanus]